MTLTASPEPAPKIAAASSAAARSRRARVLSLLGALWFALFFASLWAPPVLDDADGTHANAARQMLLSGDLVTLRVNNVRYLEKAPLPYWIAAASIRLFGANTFAVHLPQALAVLLLMLLGCRWARQAFGERAALYTGLGVLTSAGVFLFTRVFIPDVLLSLLLAAALYCLLQSLEPSADIPVILTLSDPERATRGEVESKGKNSRISSFSRLGLYPYLMWTALALAVLTKGLVAIVFLFGTAIVYLALTGDWRNWRRLRPFTGSLLFLAIAAPWHILAGLRNTGAVDSHGFFWFYFINEHVLRFLGHRIPRDYNKLPAALYWSLHLVWLFPWSLFLPLALVTGWRCWPARNRSSSRTPASSNTALNTTAARSALLLLLFSALVLVFFSLSTNQEYYTFPAYLPLLMLLAAALARAETATNLGTSQVRPSLAHLRPRRLHRARPVDRRRPRLRPLDLAPSPRAAQRRRSARPPRHRRLHTLHVLALRPHRPQLRRAAPARRPRTRRLRPRSRHRLDAPHPQAARPVFLRTRLASCRNHHHRPHLGRLPHRRLHRARPLRSHALLAGLRPDHSAPRSHRPDRTQLHPPPLRRPGLRLLHPLLSQPPAGSPRSAGRRPLFLHALRLHLPRRAAALPHTRTTRRPVGHRPAQAPLRPARAPRRCRPPPRTAPDRPRRDRRKSPPHRPPLESATCNPSIRWTRTPPHR